MAVYGFRDRNFGQIPPVVGLPRDRDAMFMSRFLAGLFPESPIAVRAKSERHILSLTRAGLGVAVIDCFVGDRYPTLRRVRPEPVDHYDLYAVAHVGMFKVPRIRAVVDFLAQLFAEEKDLLEGREPPV